LPVLKTGLGRNFQGLNILDPKTDGIKLATKATSRLDCAIFTLDRLKRDFDEPENRV
jgi:hypothetical protein